MAKSKRHSRNRVRKNRESTRLKEVTRLSSGFFLGRHRSSAVGRTTVKSSESAKVLVKKAARALEKPGIDRAVIFPLGRSANTFAYAVDPANPKLIVRESSTGRIAKGRFVDGRFKAI